MNKHPRAFDSALAARALTLANETRDSVVLNIGGIRITIWPSHSLEEIGRVWSESRQRIEAEECRQEEQDRLRKYTIEQRRINPGFTLTDREKWEKWVDALAESGTAGLDLIQQTATWAHHLEPLKDGSDPHSIGLGIGLDSMAYESAAAILRDVWRDGPRFYEKLKAGGHVYAR